MRIVSCGEAVVDFLPARDGTWTARPGGSPFNVAIGLARLGVEAGFLGRLSNDLFGDQLFERLEREGVATELVARADDPSLLAFIGFQDGLARYAFFGSGAADFGLAAPPDLPEPVRGLHVGSLALALGTTGTTMEALVAREFGRRLISLDPNPRPSLLGDADVYRARFERWLARAHIVKLSDEDLTFLAPDHAPADVAESWLERGPLLVIVTRGPQGAIWRAHGGGGSLPAPEIELADTVGAGDSFTAALLAALVQQHLDAPLLLRAAPAEQLERCVAHAVRCASLTCTRLGADPPYAHELA
jgi:fructokinase